MYGLKQTETSVTVTLSAASREELVRDLLSGVLEAAYSGPPADGDTEGQVVPVQAVGDTMEQVLNDLVRDTLDAVHEAPGTLLAPRWLAFDESRVTANLSLCAGRAPVRGVRLPDRGPAVTIESPLPAFRGTVELEVQHGAGG